MDRDRAVQISGDRAVAGLPPQQFDEGVFGVIHVPRTVRVAPESATDVENIDAASGRQTANSSGKAAIFILRDALFHTVKDRRGTQKNACVKAVKFFQPLANLHQSLIFASNPGDVFQIHEWVGGVVIDGKRDFAVARSPRGQVMQDGRIEQVIRHQQYEWLD